MTWQTVTLILGIVYAFVIVICAACIVGIVDRKLKEKRLT